ncbi:hypothetical protein GQ44DRAFT_730955 [Phaeosphaeriaceae sp. PMI808]|nr:hypothetical protein GQ44DRAFT_730955 [Phaeosphaeriaceae sp. PMI808]
MVPTERWQPIAPASDEPGQQRLAPDPRKRRQAIAIACVQCRNGKVKCDGMRPQCTRCGELHQPCQYDVPEGVTRSERMKLLRRESVINRAEELEHVIRALRTGSDEQASAILARLRIGDQVHEVAKELSPTTLSPMASGPSSLLTLDPSSTPANGISTDPTGTPSDSIPTPYRRDPQIPLTQQYGKGLPHSLTDLTDTSIQSISTEGKQPIPIIHSTSPPFLSLLFNREDYLQSISDTKDGNKTKGGTDGLVDPKVLIQSNTSHSTGGATGPSKEVSKSQTTPPRSAVFTKGISQTHGVTHLGNRQPIVNSIRLHPNLNLHNLFGNMPFSSSVRANNYPSDVQDAQINNLFLPTWAMMPVNTRPDPGSLNEAFYSLFQKTTAIIEGGAPVEHVIEVHPNIAALFDEYEFKNSGVLTRWAAGMVHSTQLKGNDFTAFGSMYVFWYLMRWMVSPSPQTYEAMPEWLRPTPNQLFMDHIMMLDFVHWPAFREFAVQIPEMQERMEWLIDMSINLRCDWYFESDEAFKRSDETGLLDLCDLAKASIGDLTSWSVGPSFRQYVANADSYVRIRTQVP